MLHGVTSEPALAMPTSGRSKSASSMPTARSMERLGVRSMPAVMLRLRLFRGVLISRLQYRTGRSLIHRCGHADRRRRRLCTAARRGYAGQPANAFR